MCIMSRSLDGSPPTRHWSLRAGLLCLCAAGVVASLPAFGQATGPRKVDSLPSTAQPANDHLAMEASDRVVPIARAGDQEGFFEGAITQDGRGLVLAFSNDPSPDLRKRLEAAAGEVPITYRRVANAASKLDAIAAQVAADQSYWSSIGVEFSSSGPDWDSNKVSISLVNYSRSFATAIEARYGPDFVTVSTESQPVAQRG